MTGEGVEGRGQMSVYLLQCKRLDIDVNQHGQDACPCHGSEPLALGQPQRDCRNKPDVRTDVRNRESHSHDGEADHGEHQRRNPGALVAGREWNMGWPLQRAKTSGPRKHQAHGSSSKC
jgi:hypothetical protein